MAPRKEDEAAPEDTGTPGTIDYSGSQAEIDKAKQAARDADKRRLADEHEPRPR